MRKTESRFIPITDAARLENVDYMCMVVRMHRGKEEYITRQLPRPGGGRPLRKVAVSSLSPGAQERYWMEQRQALRDLERREADEAARAAQAQAPPWYIGVSVDRFRHAHPEEWEEAARIASELRPLMRLKGDRGERRRQVKALAARLQVDDATIYRRLKDMKTAAALARAEQLDSGSRESNETIYQIFALCRKPRQRDTFPGLTDATRADIENVIFDRELSQNRPSKELMANEALKIMAERGRDPLPEPRTVKDYITYILDNPDNRMAYALSSKGLKRFKNEHMLKTRRDTKGLKVLEYVMGDEHTFDFWCRITGKDGRPKAIRPVLALWIDVRSRYPLGAVVCEHANMDVLKRSILKMIYQEAGSVPEILHMDNGRDYTGKAMTGVKRSERRTEGMRCSDAQLNGFYRQIGVQAVHHSRPYEPWGKSQVERVFGTFCERYSKTFSSYTGTLTGSRTDGKVPKDIKAMLNAGGLPTMEDVQALFDAFLEEYRHTAHRGLKDAGEAWTTPAEVFANAERCERPPVPYAYAQMLLLEDEDARVYNDGIHKNRRRYWAQELQAYIGQHVNVKYDKDNPGVLYAFDPATGEAICEAAEADNMSFHATPEEVEAHKRTQNRQLGAARDIVNRMRTPYEARGAEGRPKAVNAGIPGLMREGDGVPLASAVISFPEDREYRASAKQRREDTRKGDTSIYSSKGMNLALLEEMLNTDRRAN